MTTSQRPTMADLNAFIAARQLLTTKSEETYPIGRFAITLARAGGGYYRALELAQERYPSNDIVTRTFEQLQRRQENRAIVDAGDTTTTGFASQLVTPAQTIGSLFVDMLRPRTIIGRIPGVRTVPLNILIPSQSAGMAFQWTGEGSAKPAGALTVSNSTLLWGKVTGVVPITRELMRFSKSAERLIENDLLEGSQEFLDTAFVSENAEVANVSPAGILAGVASSGAASGTSADAFRADMKTLISAINVDDASELVVLMNTNDATNLSLMGNEFPKLEATGGFIGGLPVIASASVSNRLIVLHAPSVLLGDENDAEITASSEATIEMDSTPAAGEQSPPSTQSVLKSMFQNNMIAFRVDRYISWKLARSGAVRWISGTNYGGA